MESRKTRRALHGRARGAMVDPGWHIECSAMAMKHLGTTIDIHAAGRRFAISAHHENEIAQSEMATGCKPFARYWVHIAFLQH